MTDEVDCEMSDKWYWREPETSNVDGPYNSRDGAIKGGRKEGLRSFFIGKCSFANIEAAARCAADVDAMIEAMEESEMGGAWIDRPLFSAHPSAKEALESALAEWAKEHVESEYEWMWSENGEELIDPELSETLTQSEKDCADSFLRRAIEEMCRDRTQE